MSYFDGLHDFTRGELVAMRADVLTEGEGSLIPSRLVKRCQGTVRHRNGNLIEVEWETGFIGSVPPGHLTKVAAR